VYHALVDRTQISLTNEQARRLREIARRRGTSMAALIRDAVDRAYPPPGRADERWDAALAAVGGFHSGSSDVAVEHDRELDEAFRQWRYSSTRRPCMRSWTRTTAPTWPRPPDWLPCAARTWSRTRTSDTLALVSRRLGRAAVARLLDGLLAVVSVEPVDAGVHAAALADYRASDSLAVSFVDRTSFAFMRAAGIGDAFAFDEDFRTAGFDLVR
jgi:hypothetical protein